ncbi:MAG: DUF3667 domain-containing protein [Pedobacter sp.]|nr:DUF3667 domain-containing protein [Pedobacter sp.]MDQ8051823.1 DUF3667 domain-containing protein [Pedobacter sp.]
MSSFKIRKEKDCLNCGHLVEDHFCPQCGQENIELKENAFHMVSHAVADYFHFEHKFFATIKPLLFKPGKLTQAYVAGKRVKYIHPIRLYIFISIVFFLVVLSGGAEQHPANNPNKTVQPAVLTQAQQDSLVAEKVKELDASLKEGLKYVPLDSSDRAEIIEGIKKDIKKGGKGDVNYSKGWNVGSNNKFGGNWAPTDTTVAQYEKSQAALPKAKRDGFLKHYYAKRSIELNKYPNPKQKFIEDLSHNVPKMMFLILPIFALILKLVYIRKKRYYYEHLIYSFHVHAALFLAFVLIALLKWLFGLVYNISEWLILIYMIYMIWYIYRSLRTFYGSSRWITLLKLFFLFICYNFVLILGFLVIIAFSFALA